MPKRNPIDMKELVCIKGKQIFDKDELIILSASVEDKFVPKELSEKIKFIKPYILVDILSEGVKIKFDRVIKTYQKRSKVVPLQILGLKILSFRKGKKVVEYKLGRDSHSPLRHSGFVKSLEWVPLKHHIELDWTNEVVRICGPKADKEWHRIDLTETRDWINKLRKRRRSKLKPYVKKQKVM